VFATESYEWPRTPLAESLRAACCLLLLPLIVAAFTVGFAGYALWRLAYLLWQVLCLAYRAVRARRIARA